MLIRTSLGIELAGKDLRIAVVRSTFGKLRLMETIEIAGFLDLSPEEQKSALFGLARTHKLPAGNVFLTLPRDSGIIRQIDFPVEVRDKLKSAITLQMESLCPWPAEEIYWAFSADMNVKAARTITVTVVIIPRTALDPWLELFNGVKLPLSGASLSAVSTAHGVRTLWADSTPTVILDCQPGYVEGALVYGSHLVSVTQSGEEAAETARVAVERLISTSRLGPQENPRLIAHGSAAASIESLERVRLPLENAKPDSSDRFGAIASALVLLKKTAFEANLIPRALRYRQSQLQLIPTYVLICLGILVGIAMIVREPYQSMKYAARLDEEIARIAPGVSQLSAQETELNQLSEKYRVLAAHLQGRDQNLEAMREVARVLTGDAWLSNYTFQEGTITISGFATSASTVQKALEDSPLFKDVQSTSSLTRESNGKDRFAFKASIEAAQ